MTVREREPAVRGRRKREREYDVKSQLMPIKSLELMSIKMAYGRSKILALNEI